MFREREAVTSGNFGATRTQQNFTDECDINRIMKQYQRVGEFGHVTRATATYGDFSNPVDYQTALNQVKAAQADFDGLPSSIRKRMDNNPALLLDFLSNEENNAEAIELGLRPAPPEPAEPIPPTPEPPTPGVQGGETPKV